MQQIHSLAYGLCYSFADLICAVKQINTHKGQSDALTAVSMAFASFLQLILNFDGRGKDKMEVWQGRQAVVHADSMELVLQEAQLEDQEMPEWEPAEEGNMVSYKSVGDKLAFEQ